MNTIKYTFSTKSKQIFGILVFVYFLLRFLVLVEIKAFHLEGYTVYLIPSIIYYGIIFAGIWIVFLGYRLFYTEYDENKITYYNTLMKKSYSASWEDVRFVRFDTNGIHFFDSYSDDAGATELLRIPYFRLGVIRAIPVNDLFEKLIENPNIKVQKTFKVLPGYTKKWRVISMVYALFCVCMLILCRTPLYTVLILFQNCR